MNTFEKLETLTNSTSLGNRLPEWSKPGCCMNPNGSTNWKWLHQINVGEHMDLAYVGSSAQVIASRLGIGVSVNALPNGDVRVTRIK